MVWLWWLWPFSHLVETAAPCCLFFLLTVRCWLPLLIFSLPFLFCSFMKRRPEWWTQTRKGRTRATLLAVLRWVCLSVKRCTSRRREEQAAASRTRVKLNSVQPSRTLTVNKAAGVKIPVESSLGCCSYLTVSIFCTYNYCHLAFYKPNSDSPRRTIWWYIDTNMRWPSSSLPSRTTTCYQVRYGCRQYRGITENT